LGFEAIRKSCHRYRAARVLALVYEAAGDLHGTLYACYGLWALGVKEPALFEKMGRIYLAGQNGAEATRFFRKACAMRIIFRLSMDCQKLRRRKAMSIPFAT